MITPKLKKYFNDIPGDFQPLITRAYCFHRMQSIIRWNEINCDYWTGIEDQIKIYQRNIKFCEKNGGLLWEWSYFEEVPQFEVVELQMLLIYRRELAIRNILE